MASLASWLTNLSASIVAEVSTILGCGALDVEGPIDFGLGGRAYATKGKVGGVRSLSTLLEGLLRGTMESTGS